MTRRAHPADRHPEAAAVLYGAALGALLFWPLAGALAIAVLWVAGEALSDRHGRNTEEHRP